MKLKDWGEENFIAFLQSQFEPPSQAVGIGDDCAVLAKGRGFQLITTDALVEDIHFTDAVTPENLGFKTVAVNVSDIAAKGGRPEHAFLTLALPAALDVQWLKRFMQGFKLACERYNISLLGGDTVGSKQSIFINLTLLGSAKKVKLRSSAKIGDVIAVSGFLGDSLAGLMLMQQNIGSKFTPLVEAHTTPDVYPEQGQWLASQSSVHAMMDVSDGLDSDLRKLLKASGCGARINADCFPTSNALQKACKLLDWNLMEIAATGGEDYVLLCTVDSDDFPKVAKGFERRFASPLHPIGVIEEKGLKYLSNGKPMPLSVLPFSHF